MDNKIAEEKRLQVHRMYADYCLTMNTQSSHEFYSNVDFAIWLDTYIKNDPDFAPYMDAIRRIPVYTI